MTTSEYRKLLPDEATTCAVAAATAPLLMPGDLLVLSGDLGAGKTFFVRALCYALGLDPDEPVTSPTFTLVHEYEADVLVLHADLYRLSDPSEVEELGLEARRDDAVVVVEWGAPFVNELGGGATFFDFEIEPRALRVHGDHPRSRALIDALCELSERA